MAKQEINIGTVANDGTGDTIRDSFDITNQNFDESFLDNRILVNQSNKDTTLGGTIDSTKEYFLDGVIDMGSTPIEVPSTGIYISGYNFDVSGLTSSVSSYSLFTSPVGGSGSVLFNDFHIDVSGASSQVYNLVADTGFEAIEVNRINWNNCTSLGEISGYRQGLETGTGRFGGTPNLVLSGTWLGGYFIDTSIVRSLTDGVYSLYEEGTSFVMNSRFRSNQNIDLPASASFFDFQASNFTNSSTLQMSGCIISRNGIIDAGDSNITPNIDQTEVVSVWRNNVGLPNTFIGGSLNVTAEVTTTISSSGTFVDLDGTFTENDLQHFDSPSSGQLRHIGDSPREFRVLFEGILESGSNDEVDLKFVVWDDSDSSFVDYKITRRVVNNLQGGRDVAFFTVINNVILDKNDYIKMQVANVNDTNNITAELDTDIIVEER